MKGRYRRIDVQPKRQERQNKGRWYSTLDNTLPACQNTPDMQKATYKDAGVDLDIYAESMSRLPKLVKRTFSDRVLQLDGGFAGLFQLNGKTAKYADPVLVSCTDGVGTKLKVACQANRHTTIGIDLVAMSVNDAICCGAEPLFFLDYAAMPKDDPGLLEQIVSGITEGCLQSRCALIGGETAIMSGLYQPGEYDLAGFCVGVAERTDIIDGKAIQSGDVLIGIESSGLHSNGYSLVRKIVFDIAGLNIHENVPELGATIADVLLTPTRIYAGCVRKILERYGANKGISGIAHITGGGLEENLSRILPVGTALNIRRTWEPPPVFGWLQRLGNVDDGEMDRVFNQGIGLVLAVKPDIAEDVMQTLRTATAWKCWNIGSIRN
ncbi:MAG: phosphoribosylformylglycinamidine cyclo-ligase [Planctomycetaceae bacterium]|jgi:phosphoribosylformylglycinamidine cyclo-ligase|nr:phosphoribosylformylglycinamidine cyclo-ligase [Planctomycetaceae bacterium]